MRVGAGPEGLAEMPPGPALGAALADLDLAEVSSSDTVTVLQARYRQLAHEQAGVLTALVEVARSDRDALGATTRSSAVGEWACGEVAAALSLTTVAADREVGFAEAVVTRLPLVHAALSIGQIDRPKAWVFADYLSDVPDEHIAVICAALVPEAPRLTTGQLRARLVRMLHDIDPAHARRRYERAVRERAVVGYLQPDGTVNVTASGLPADEAAVACERLDQLAHAIQRAGHPGRLGQIQTDLFLGMLDGSLHHLHEHQIITTLLARVRPEDTQDTGDTERPAAPTSAERLAESTSAERPAEPACDVEQPAEPPNTERPAEPASDVEQPAAGAAADEPGDSAASETEQPAASVAERPAESPGADESGESEDADEPGGAPSAAEPSAPVPGDTAEHIGPAQHQLSPWPRAGVEVRLGLGTAIGLDERCGEVAGLGPVLAHTARALLAGQYRGARWRFAILDDDGQLLHAGLTRRRPALASGRGCRDGVVELHVTVEELTELLDDPERSGPWAVVIADIAAQHAHHEQGAPGEDHRSTGRFARAALARHIEVRDRTCCFPGCRRPARRCEKDHTRDHADGGPMTSWNIGPLCDRHHAWKSKHWWRLTQAKPGQFSWLSPLGRSYRTRGEPIRPPTVPHTRDPNGRGREPRSITRGPSCDGHHHDRSPDANRPQPTPTNHRHSEPGSRRRQGVRRRTVPVRRSGHNARADQAELGARSGRGGAGQSGAAKQRRATARRTVSIRSRWSAALSTSRLKSTSVS